MNNNHNRHIPSGRRGGQALVPPGLRHPDLRRRGRDEHLRHSGREGERLLLQGDGGCAQGPVADDMCIYIYIYTHICICVYISLSISLSLYIYIYIYMYREIYTHTPTHMIYTHIHTCVCTYICIYIYISLSIYIYIYIYTHT